jgi:hypothetical protein
MADVVEEVRKILNSEGLAMQVSIKYESPEIWSLPDYLPKIGEVEVIESIDVRIQRELEKRGREIPSEYSLCYITRGYLSGILSVLLGDDFVILEENPDNHRQKVNIGKRKVEKCIYKLKRKE